jgi:hypothetical protein
LAGSSPSQENITTGIVGEQGNASQLEQETESKINSCPEAFAFNATSLKCEPTPSLGKTKQSTNQTNAESMVDPCPQGYILNSSSQKCENIERSIKVPPELIRGL